MRISSISLHQSTPRASPQLVASSAASGWRRLLRMFLARLAHVGAAIAAGEAGDLDGAQALRERLTRHIN